MEYGSPESLEFTDLYFMLLNYWTLVESNAIAKEKGEVFHNFEKSAYADGSYFTDYIQGDYQPKSEKVKALFEGVFYQLVKIGQPWHKPSKKPACITKTA